jgi:hypothetical protein
MDWDMDIDEIDERVVKRSKASHRSKKCSSRLRVSKATSSDQCKEKADKKKKADKNKKATKGDTEVGTKVPKATMKCKKRLLPDNSDSNKDKKQKVPESKKRPLSLEDLTDPLVCGTCCVRKKLRLGTFFSGAETPSMAFQYMNIDKLDVDLEFTVEIDEFLKRSIETKWKPRESHGDINDVCLRKLPHTDVIISGSPCPAFSSLSSSLHGTDDPDGALIYKLIEYIEEESKRGCPPKIAIGENSRMLLKPKFAGLLSELKHRLKAADSRYRVTCREQDTRMNGIPQRRRRSYIIAIIEASGREFQWPSKLSYVMPMSKILYRKNKHVTVKSHDTDLNRTRIAQVMIMFV